MTGGLVRELRAPRGILRIFGLLAAQLPILVSKLLAIRRTVSNRISGYQVLFYSVPVQMSKASMGKSCRLRG